MNNFLGFVFGILFAAAAIFFVILQTDTGRVCQNHPDKSLKDDYLYCYPGFKLKKDSFILPETEFKGRDSLVKNIYVNEIQKKKKKKKEIVNEEE